MDTGKKMIKQEQQEPEREVDETYVRTTRRRRRSRTRMSEDEDGDHGRRSNSRSHCCHCPWDQFTQWKLDHPNDYFLIIMSILCCVMFANVLMLSTSLDSYTHACGRVEQWLVNVAKAAAAAASAAANCTKA
jgi:hypothetical protein